jgi:hypothetical protein
MAYMLDKAEPVSWRSWGITGRALLWAVRLGLASGCSTVGTARGVQHFGFWHGRRGYVLGLQREWWSCLLMRGALRRPHIPSRDERYGVWCGRCLPCTDCGETRWNHSCPAVTA